MSEHNHSHPGPSPSGALWRSRAGVILIGFAAIAGLLLAYEHRVHLFTGNGLLLVLLAVCVGMHFFLHGGHGGGNRGPDEGDRP